MMMIALIGLGGFSMSRMNLSQMPDVDFPVVNVILNLDGATAKVMETDVVDIVEEVILTVEGVKEIKSYSKDYTANIAVELELSRDVDVALQEIQTKIAQVQNKLPVEMDPPILMKSNPEDNPIVWVSLTSDVHSKKDMVLYVKDVLKDQFQKIPGVGEIYLGGYVDRTVNVYLDPKKLTQREITVDDITNTLLEQNIEIPGGRVENRLEEYGLRSIGEVPQVSSFQEIYVNSRSGVPIYSLIKLGDIAKIEDGLDDIRRISRFNGSPSIGLGIKKLKGYNAVDIADNIKELVESLQDDIPDGYKLQLASDNTIFIRESIGELQFTMLLSALLTGFVTRIFLGSWKSTWNILLAIPTSILGTFFFLELFGFTLNTFTLLGLTLATGIVVDDAIMVLENIVRHREMGKGWREAAIKGTKEVQFAALSATLAIVAIFLPVAFISGIIGRYFLEFAVTVSVAVLLSLFEALTFTPMRASQFKDDESVKLSKFDSWVDSRMISIQDKYRQTLDWSLNHPKTIISLSFGFFALSLLLIIPLKKEFVPAQDTGRFLIRMRAPVGYSIYRTDQEVRPIEDYLRSKEEIYSYFIAVGGVGGGDVNTAMIYATLKNKNDRPINSDTGKSITQKEIFEKLRNELPIVAPSLKISIQDFSLGGFSAGRGYPVEIQVTGSDWDVLASNSEILKEKLENSGYLTDVDSDYNKGQPELRLVPDRRSAALMGVSIANIGNTVGTLMGGRKAGKFTENGRTYDVKVRIDKKEGEDPKSLYETSVRNTHGEIVMLSRLLKFEETESQKNITRVDRARSITIYGNPKDPFSQQQAIEESLRIAKEILPQGYIAKITGAAKTSSESMNSLIAVLGVGILISYMILASQFNHLRQPIYILLALPFSFSGALIALYSFGQSINVYSFIGLILLLGLVKKNSIILVEFINQVRHKLQTSKKISKARSKKTFENADIDSANSLENYKEEMHSAILEASPLRMRPILMTSFSSIAAAIPPALAIGPGEETRIPMAITILGGMFLSTLVTLYLVPVAYGWVEGKMLNRK
ncbi:efflux RND transporter permease subunit [Leptospira sp. GIMC2001]|nr:efflux RND transporter permease subunit [Leptospira sp. GIMC2001]WCL51414.1 efflux RND transporter permease subunit [Leptospira sp. GIMC2001]